MNFVINCSHIISDIIKKKKMKRHILLLLFLGFVMLTGYAQTYFRSGIFLHHSTGACIWGPNGSSTSIPQEMDAYNALHGYTGARAVTMNEEWWAPADNEWATQHAFFEDPSPVSGIGYYLPGNKIIVIKTCFPASSMTGAGQLSDTTDPYKKTVWNYKWHWRHIVRVMQDHPENFFAIWTNAPLEPGSTTESEAALSKWFCAWAKDTLEAGLDPEFGAFPPNVYVFDFFSKLTGSNGMMLMMYAAGSGNSHPNATATELVAPQFVSEIFTASILYEVIYGNQEIENPFEAVIKCYPNPCKESLTVAFQSSCKEHININLYDLTGRCLLKITDSSYEPGSHTLPVSLSSVGNGIFIVRWIKGDASDASYLVISR